MLIVESGLQVTVNTGRELALQKLYRQPQVNAANAQALNVNYSIDWLGVFMKHSFGLDTMNNPQKSDTCTM